VKRRKLRRTDLVAAEIGLAGARRKELSMRMREPSSVWNAVKLWLL